MNDACESLVSAYQDIIEQEEREFPDSIYDAYCEINVKYISMLKIIVFDDKWGKAVANEKEKYHSKGKRNPIAAAAKKMSYEAMLASTLFSSKTKEK